MTIDSEFASPEPTRAAPTNGAIPTASESVPGFHGWRLVASAAGLHFLIAGLMTQAFGSYVAVLRDTEGWSKTALSGLAAMQQVEGALLGPVQGWIVDRFGTRGLVRAGLVLFGGGMMLLSTATSLASFYAIYLLIAIGISLAGYFTLSVAVINWFERHRNRALSMLQISLVGAGLVAPVIAWSLQTFGWRATAFGSGLIALLVGLPLSAALHRRPQDLGQYIDGIAPPARIAGDNSAANEMAATAIVDPYSQGATVAQALRSRAFWLLGLGHASALFVVSAFQVHAVTHVKEGLGYSLAQAALMLSVQTVAYAIGLFTSGVLGDRWDKARTSAGCLLLHATGLLTLAYASSMAAVLAAAIAHGFAWGLRGPLMQAMRADHFGRRAIGAILGLSMGIVLIGQVSGPMIAGVLADATGNYRLGFTILGAMAGLGSIFFLLVPKLPDRSHAGA